MEDLFCEMVFIPQLVLNPNFSVEVVMIQEGQTRRYEGKRQWRRHEWAIEERRLLAVLAGDRRPFHLESGAAGRYRRQAVRRLIDRSAPRSKGPGSREPTFSTPGDPPAGLPRAVNCAGQAGRHGERRCGDAGWRAGVS